MTNMDKVLMTDKFLIYLKKSLKLNAIILALPTVKPQHPLAHLAAPQAARRAVALLAAEDLPALLHPAGRPIIPLKKLLALHLLPLSAALVVNAAMIQLHHALHLQLLTAIAGLHAAQAHQLIAPLALAHLTVAKNPKIRSLSKV